MTMGNQSSSSEYQRETATVPGYGDTIESLCTTKIKWWIIDLHVYICSLNALNIWWCISIIK
jgi:hypothetical protein